MHVPTEVSRREEPQRALQVHHRDVAIDQQGKLILILLSVGLLVDAATGPSRIVLMMTGHERQYVRIFGSIVVAGMVAQLAVIPVFGLVGAAVMNMIARIAAQLAIAWFANRRIGLDTTLLGAFLVNRLADSAPPQPARSP